ncbi:MAG TPA: hypothetical protein VGC15_22270 [Acetobacteraceae bacterium]
MARKPKAARSSNFATSPEQVLAVLSEAPAPARRGRKPKTAATPEPLAMMDSDDAVGGSVDADGSIADPVAPPVRKRPGPKPKPRAGTAEAARSQDHADAKPGREVQALEAAPEHMATADGTPGAEADDQQDQQGQLGGPKPPMPEPALTTAASNTAPCGLSQNVATSAQTVAQWDRATDTVRFNWAEIERTASQDGPNQVMAKLLVAARAEGANSRWPL